MRRAQITIFILLGIVLLLGVIIGLAMYKNVLKFRPPEELVISEVPTELKPLVFAVQQCQQNLADDVIRQILAQGGYLDPQQHGVIAVQPPAGTGVDAQGLLVPYWHYIQDGAKHTKKPSLNSPFSDSIKVQVERYVDEHIEDCVPWDSFPQYEIERLVPNTEVYFRDTVTTMHTTWNVRVTTALGQTDIPAFEATLDAPVERLYAAADEMVFTLQDYAVPEAQLLEFLQLYSTGTNHLPPLNAPTSTGYDIHVYPLFSAHDELSEVIQMATETLQVPESLDWQVVLTTDEPAIDDLYLGGLVPLQTPSDHMRVRATYAQDFGMRWLVNNNIGVAMPTITKPPGPLSILFPPMVENTYSTDLSYPIVLSFEQNGYVLNAGYEVNIKDDAPMPAEEQEEDASDSYCTAPGGSQLELTIDPVVTASAVYSCAATSCALGDIIDGRLSTTLPACAQGTLDIYAKDYFSEPQEISSAFGTETIRKRVPLYKPRPATVHVNARQVSKVATDVYALSPVTKAQKNVTVYFIRQGQPYFATPNEEGVAMLVPGTYDVYIIGMQEWSETEPFSIDAECRYPDVGFLGGLFTGADDECIDLPQINFTEMPIVYAEFTGENGIVIDKVIDSIDITAASINPYAMLKIEDVALLGELFTQAGTLHAEDSVKMK